MQKMPDHIEEHVPLAQYSTMRLGGKARYLATADSPQSLVELEGWARSQNMSVVVLGGGSNVVFTDAGYPGLVILCRIIRIWTFELGQERPGMG
jgi:UDP-N-acetylmuramate dehydrogenase